MYVTTTYLHSKSKVSPGFVPKKQGPKQKWFFTRWIESIEFCQLVSSVGITLSPHIFVIYFLDDIWSVLLLLWPKTGGGGDCPLAPGLRRPSLVAIAQTTKINREPYCIIVRMMGSQSTGKQTGRTTWFMKPKLYVLQAAQCTCLVFYLLYYHKKVRFM